MPEEPSISAMLAMRSAPDQRCRRQHRPGIPTVVSMVRNQITCTAIATLSRTVGGVGRDMHQVGTRSSSSLEPELRAEHDRHRRTDLTSSAATAAASRGASSCHCTLRRRALAPITTAVGGCRGEVLDRRAVARISSAPDARAVASALG